MIAQDLSREVKDEYSEHPSKLQARALMLEDQHLPFLDRLAQALLLMEALATDGPGIAVLSLPATGWTDEATAATAVACAVAHAVVSGQLRAEDRVPKLSPLD